MCARFDITWTNETPKQKWRKKTRNEWYCQSEWPNRISLVKPKFIFRKFRVSNCKHWNQLPNHHQLVQCIARFYSLCVLLFLTRVQHSNWTSTHHQFYVQSNNIHWMLLIAWINFKYSVICWCHWMFNGFHRSRCTTEIIG